MSQPYGQKKVLSSDWNVSSCEDNPHGEKKKEAKNSPISVNEHVFRRGLYEVRSVFFGINYTCVVIRRSTQAAAVGTLEVSGRVVEVT